jgi:hypothetical protein
MLSQSALVHRLFYHGLLKNVTNLILTWIYDLEDSSAEDGELENGGSEDSISESFEDHEDKILECMNQTLPKLSIAIAGVLPSVRRISHTVHAGFGSRHNLGIDYDLTRLNGDISLAPCQYVS